MSITAIIVTHNSAGIVTEALGCITPHEDISACVVIDNASSDNTLDVIRARFPGVQIIGNQQNKGFGVACNQALEKIATPFALLMNPDARINAEGISRLLSVLHDYPQAAMAAPFLQGDAADKSTDALRFPFIHDNDTPLAIPLAKDISSVSFVSGALSLWRMQYMKTIGFFDPALFLFYEDDDVCIRTRKAGYDMLLVDGIHADHRLGLSVAESTTLRGLKLKCLAWGELYMTQKYRGRQAALLLATARLLQQGVLYIGSLLYSIPCLLMDQPYKAGLVREDHTSRFIGAVRFLMNRTSV